MKNFLILFLIILFNLPSYAENYFNLDWWKRFNDDNLVNNLVVVYEKNYDLKNAALKVKENENIVKMQFAQELPFINFSGDLNRDLQAPRQQFGAMSIPKYSQYNYNLPLTAGYEIDIWQKNRLKTKSLKQDLEISKELERAAYILLSSDFSADYFNLIKADKLLEIQNELVNTQEKIVSMTMEKYKAGLCSINELLAEENFLTNLKEEKNKHKLTKNVLEESLKVYLSNNNDKIVRTKYEKLTLLNNLPKEYDSAIIENRPDFKQQEANIKKIGFDIQIAKREFLPKFTIIGQLGLNAYSLNNLFNSSSWFFNLGVLPSMDLFSGGRKLAFLKLNKYKYDEALNDYQKTILVGIKEVNSSVFEYKTSLNNYLESKKRLDTQAKIYNLAKDKNKIGASGNIDVLYAKEAYLLKEKETVSNKINSLISAISIYKAAGGVDLFKDFI